MRLRDRRKHRGEFFTSNDVSTFLVNQVESVAPRFFIDLGAGRGSLSRAVQSRWNGIRGSTVEIDSINLQFLKQNCPHLNHYEHNILSFDFVSRLRDEISEPIDLIVSNPPFIKVRMDDKLRNSFKNSPFEEHAFRRTCVESELVFIMHATKLIDDLGEIAVIVPDFIITSSKARSIREALYNEFGLFKVIELKSRCFSATDVKTHIIFLKKHAVDNRRVRVSRIDSSETILISNRNFFDRGDYKYYSLSENAIDNSKMVNLGDVCKITRGNLPMHIADLHRLRPFHTTDFLTGNSSGDDQIDYGLFSQSDMYRRASRGDLLMGRVGRNISRQRMYVESGGFNISDCVFCISPIDSDPHIINLVNDRFSSDFGVNWMESVFRGSGARSISLRDLQNFPIAIGGRDE